MKKKLKYLSVILLLTLPAKKMYSQSGNTEPKPPVSQTRIHTEDVIITAVSVSSIYNGRRKISFTVKNIGNRDIIINNISLQAYVGISCTNSTINMQKVCDAFTFAIRPRGDYIPMLKAGETRDSYIDCNVTPQWTGQTKLMLVADIYNKISESNEDNNTYCVAFN